MTDAMKDDGNEPATKADLRGLETRLDGHDVRFGSIEGNLRRLNIGFARVEGDLTELKSKVDILLTVKEDLSRFGSNLDRATNYFESCVRKMDSQGSMLMEHEGRIAKLESRPS